MSREHVLLNLDCAKMNKKGELVFTNAGAFFFRDNTEDVFFDHAKIVCALFKGTGKAKVIDAEQFNGCMIDNIDDAVKFLWKSLRVRHEFEGVQRKNVPEIPDVALREAVTVRREKRRGEMQTELRTTRTDWSSVRPEPTVTCVAGNCGV